MGSCCGKPSQHTNSTELQPRPAHTQGIAPGNQPSTPFPHTLSVPNETATLDQDAITSAPASQRPNIENTITTNSYRDQGQSDPDSSAGISANTDAAGAMKQGKLRKKMSERFKALGQPDEYGITPLQRWTDITGEVHQQRLRGQRLSA